MTHDPYRRWDDADAVARFAGKTSADFFRTETHFLSPIAHELESVLDIGCASGRFVDLLASLGAHPAYTGIDISPGQLASARRLYPHAAFHLGNALDLDLEGGFDLVNATGVMQHEPRFAALIARMVGWSRRWVLFDVKFAPVGEDIVDTARAHAGTPEHPLYFNILSATGFLERLCRLEGIARASVYGYETPPNLSTTLPPEATMLVSAGVLLERGPAPVVLEHDLPDGVA